MYGETGTVMRQELAGLLRQHRVQQRLGGPPEARHEAGLLIRRYRQNVQLWCSQAMRASSPVTFSNLAPAQPNPFRAVGGAGNGATPAGELARALELARQQSTALPATSEQVTTPTGHDVLERWRESARAASLAEHDTAHEVAQHMTAGQAKVVVGDVAAITQELVVLDQRYRKTPGW